MTGLRCCYVDCGVPATGIVAINLEESDGITAVTLPGCAEHAHHDPETQKLVITYDAKRKPNLVMEFEQRVLIHCNGCDATWEDQAECACECSNPLEPTYEQWVLV